MLKPDSVGSKKAAYERLKFMPQPLMSGVNEFVFLTLTRFMLSFPEQITHGKESASS